MFANQDSFELPKRHSTSSISTFLDCQHAYFLERIVGLTSLRDDERMSLGTLVHAGTEAALRHRTTDEETRHTAITTAIKDAIKPTMVLEGDEESLAGAITLNFLKEFKLEEWEVVAVGIREEGLTRFVPAIELECNIRSGDRHIVGKIDLIARHIPTGTIWLIDYKVRKTFYTEEQEECSAQFGLYAWLCREQFGLKLDGRMTIQIKPWVPEIPKMNKDGTLSKAASARTTWELYKYTVEQLGLKLSDYAMMEDKLANVQFVKITRTYANQVEVTGQAFNFFNAIEQIEHIHKLGWDKATRNLRPHWCGRCKFRILCLEGLRGGDEQFIADTQYKRRGQLPIAVDDVDFTDEEE